MVDSSVGKIVTRCCNLLTISLSGCLKLTDISTAAVGGNCHKLQSIDLSNNFEISNDGIIKISRGCPILLNVYLSMAGATTNYYQVETSQVLVL